MGMEKGCARAVEATVEEAGVAAAAAATEEGDRALTSPPPPLLEEEEEEEEEVVVVVVAGVEKAATMVRVRPTPPHSTISKPTEGSEVAR